MYDLIELEFDYDWNLYVVEESYVSIDYCFRSISVLWVIELEIFEILIKSCGNNCLQFEGLLKLFVDLLLLFVCMYPKRTDSDSSFVLMTNV